MLESFVNDTSKIKLDYHTESSEYSAKPGNGKPQTVALWLLFKHRWPDARDWMMQYLLFLRIHLVCLICNTELWDLLSLDRHEVEVLVCCRCLGQSLIHTSTSSTDPETLQKKDSAVIFLAATKLSTRREPWHVINGQNINIAPLAQKCSVESGSVSQDWLSQHDTVSVAKSSLVQIRHDPFLCIVVISDVKSFPFPCEAVCVYFFSRWL